MEVKTNLKKYLPFRFPFNTPYSERVGYALKGGRKVKYVLDIGVGIREVYDSFNKVILPFKSITKFRVASSSTSLYFYVDGLLSDKVVKISFDGVIEETVKVERRVGRVWLVYKDDVLYVFEEIIGGLQYRTSTDNFATPTRILNLNNETIHFLGVTEEGSFGIMTKVLSNSGQFKEKTSMRQVFLPPNHFSFTRVEKVS